MPLRYCENPGCRRIFCSRWEDVGEVVLNQMLLRFKVLTRSSEVGVFLIVFEDGALGIIVVDGEG